MLTKHIIYFLCGDRDNTPYTKTRRFSIIAYNKVIKKILDSHSPNERVSEKDIDTLHLTKYMTEKITNYFSKKVPATAEKSILKSLLTNITGIGSKKADELINKGLKNVKQLNKKKYLDLLNTDSKIAIKYKPLKKIPHSTIKKIASILVKFPGTFIVGGFRRKKSFSKDIDVMIVSKNKNVLGAYIKHLKEHFNVVVYLKGDDKISLLIKKNVCLKLDVFRTLPASKHAMLLYSTGSKFFNIRMRAIAKKQGFLLNQTGLYKNGKKIIIRSEKGFFTKLGMPYIEPEKR